MEMIKSFNPAIQSKLHGLWLDLQITSSNTLQEPVLYYPTSLALNDDTSWSELEKLLAILRDAGGIKVLDKITDGGRYNLTTGYVIKLIQPTFSELESIFPSWDLNSTELEDKSLLAIIPDDKTHKTLRKMANLLASKEETDNYHLAKCIDPKLTRKEYGNGKQYNILIKNRFKTLNTYLKKQGLFASMDGTHSKIISYLKK